MALTIEAQTEQALVGSLIIDPDKIISVADIIKPTDFTDERAQLAYTAIFDGWKSKQPINILTVVKKHPAISQYITESINQAFPPGVRGFAHDISGSARNRRVKTGLEAAAKSGGNADSMLSGAISIYKSEMASGNKAPDISSVIKRVDGSIVKNKKKGNYGFSTGISHCDDLYIRYLPGHIWTIGGFTSVGKTATMVQKICYLISSGENASIVIISTEMTEEQVVARIISNFTGIHSVRILSGNYHDAEEFDRVEQVKSLLKDIKLSIYDDIYTLEEIEIAFRKADLQGGVNIGFVDYVQNCRWPGAKSQYQEQSEMAKRFQVLAKDVRATIICLSQVSNDVGRGNTDQLELKGAGEWAAVSDVGVMLSRHKTEDYRLKYSIKKNRHGARGEFEFEYKNNYTRLEERK